VLLAPAAHWRIGSCNAAIYASRRARMCSRAREHHIDFTLVRLILCAIGPLYANERQLITCACRIQLGRTLSCTNVVESAFSIVETVCRNVKRWRPGAELPLGDQQPRANPALNPGLTIPPWAPSAERYFTWAGVCQTPNTSRTGFSLVPSPKERSVCTVSGSMYVPNSRSQKVNRFAIFAR
jgi:hypothetical protein